MWRLVIARLRLDWRRSLATFLAVWFAVSSFVVLTGSTTTQRLEATQTLQDNWRSSFDLLVRPSDARTDLEAENGQVRQAFLAETYGGLTIAQWESIKSIPGIEVAAPITTLGIIWAEVPLRVDLSNLVAPSGTQLFRVQFEDISRGQTFTGRGAFLYVTDNPLSPPEFINMGTPPGHPSDWYMPTGPIERLLDGREVFPCIPSQSNAAAAAAAQFTDNLLAELGFDSDPVDRVISPFDPTAWETFCVSRVDAQMNSFVLDIPMAFPIGVAAIDPKSEAKLFGLDNAIVAGDFLAVESAWRERVVSSQYWDARPSMPVTPALLAATAPPTDFVSIAYISEISEEGIAEMLAVDPTTPRITWEMAQANFQLEDITRRRENFAAMLEQIGGEFRGRRIDQLLAVAAAPASQTLVTQIIPAATAYGWFVADLISRISAGLTDQEWADLPEGVFQQPVLESSEIWACRFDTPRLGGFGGQGFQASVNALGQPTFSAAASQVGMLRFAVPASGTCIARMRHTAGHPTPWEVQVALPIPGTLAGSSYRTFEIQNVASVGLGAWNRVGSIVFNVVGVFDPSLVTDTGTYLNRMDLNTYTIANIVAADAETASLLENESFLFNLNPFDYAPLRPSLFVPLQNIEIFDQPWVDSLVNPINFEAPISAIRIRLADVDEFDEASQIRVATAAQEIYNRTGLDAELIIGSSLVDIPVTLTQIGDRPDLHLFERWSQAGVAGVIVDAVDQKSVLLFTLILASGILTIAAVASAAAAAQRHDLGTLAAIGYKPRKLWGYLLAQQTGIGLIAGILGAVIAWPIAQLMGAHIPFSRALLAIPIATVLTGLAALPSAFSASRTYPLKLLKPPVRAPKKAIPVTSAIRMGALSMLRRPLRLLRAALAIAIAVTAVTVLMVINTLFQGMVSGTLLGNSVLLQVRTADIIAGVILTILGLVCLGMTMRFAHLEDASDWAVLAAVGWQPKLITTAILTQGTLAGLIGALIGLGIAIVLAVNLIGTTVAAAIVPAGIVALATAALATATAIIPAVALQRAHLAQTLTRD